MRCTSVETCHANLQSSCPDFEFPLVLTDQVQTASRVEQGEGESLGEEKEGNKQTRVSTHICMHTPMRTHTHLQHWIGVLFENRCGLSKYNACDLTDHHSRFLLSGRVPNEAREIHRQLKLAKVGTGLKSEGEGIELGEGRSGARSEDGENGHLGNKTGVQYENSASL